MSRIGKKFEELRSREHLAVAFIQLDRQDIELHADPLRLGIAVSGQDGGDVAG